MIAHPHDDIEAFALGSLASAALARVLEHADRCPACAVLLADAMQLVEAMDRGADRPVRSAAIRQFRTASARSRIAGWAAAIAAAAAILGLSLWNNNLRSNVPLVPIASLVHSHFLHHGLHGASGAAKVIQATDGRWLYLVADGLAPKTQYDFFETAGGVRRRLGDFKTDAAGRATSYWEQTSIKIGAYAIMPTGFADPKRELRWP